jgi:DNA-binding MarR family transcriptional regulator
LRRQSQCLEYRRRLVCRQPFGAYSCDASEFTTGALTEPLKWSILCVHTYNMTTAAFGRQPADALFELPCACQNLRRLTRITTRIYDQELKKAGLEITQFGLLTALATAGEINQRRLSAGFAMDSTTLTRTLGPLREKGWIQVKRGKDRRERLFSLTRAGKRQIADAQPHWELAEQRLRQALGEAGWKDMKQTVSRITEAAMVG